MKLNADYLKATGLIVGGLVWTVAATALLGLFIVSIVSLNFGLLALTAIMITVFVYLTVMICDKLDFL